MMKNKRTMIIVFLQDYEFKVFSTAPLQQNMSHSYVIYILCKKCNVTHTYQYIRSAKSTHLLSFRQRKHLICLNISNYFIHWYTFTNDHKSAPPESLFSSVYLQRSYLNLLWWPGTRLASPDTVTMTTYLFHVHAFKCRTYLVFYL